MAPEDTCALFMERLSVNPYAEIDEVNPNRIVIRVAFTSKDLIKQLPGSTWSHKDQAWKLPLGWSACITLRAVFGPALEVGPNLTAWAQEMYATRIGPALALRDSTQREGLGDPTLYPFQQAGVAFLATAKRALLADEMGSGKTRQTIKAMQQLYLNGENPFPVLIVCPNSMKTTWAREADEAWSGIKFLPVKGSAAQRRKILETPAHGYIMNWESLRGHSRLAPYGSIALKRCKECGGEDERTTATQCHVHPRELNQLKFQTVIADEAHRAKQAQAQVTRALWAATGDAPYRFALTGTPIANAPDDLWPIMHWLDAAQFPSRTRWIDRFCEVMYNAFGSPTVIGIKPEREAEFQAIVNPMMRRMPKSLVLPFLPDIVRERREVEMSPKQAKAYKQMSEQMIAELENGDTLIAASPLVKATRLIQFSSAFAHLEIETKPDGVVETNVKLSDPSCKIDAFMDDLADYAGKSVVVFAQSKQLINLLSDRLNKQKKPIPHGLITGDQSTDERQKHMDAFQAGKTSLILCTVQAGGTGITLTKGSVAVFLQRSWSLIDTKQAEARIHRIGSEIHESVTIIDYVTAGTIEDYQIDALLKKNSNLEAIVRDADLLKRVLLKQSIDEDEAVEVA